MEYLFPWHAQAFGYASKYSTTAVHISTMVHQAYIRFLSPLTFNNKGEHLNHTTQSNKIKYRLEHMHYLIHILMFVSAGGRRLSAAVNSWLVDELIGVFYLSLYHKWCSTNACKCRCVSQPRKTILIEHMLLSSRIGLAVIFSMSSLTDLTCLPQAGA